MTECFHSSKYFCFDTIASSFEDKANLSNIDKEYPIKFQYFAKIFLEPRGTYFNWFGKDQELGLINCDKIPSVLNWIPCNVKDEESKVQRLLKNPKQIAGYFIWEPKILELQSFKMR